MLPFTLFVFLVCSIFLLLLLFLISCFQVAIVTMFHVDGSWKKIVQCHNSSCTLSSGHKRSLKKLDQGSVCAHLELFKGFYEDCSSDEEMDLQEVDDNNLPLEKV